MEFLKALDTIRHGFLIAKLNTYGLDRMSLVFLYFCWKWSKQCVNVNKLQSTFQTLLSGISRGSIIGPLLYNVFINDLIGLIKKSSLHNFGYDNTITAFEKYITLLKETLQKEAEIWNQCFKDNFMIVNPGKFQAMVINRFENMENKHKMYIENKKIIWEHSVKLLDIEIDSQLNIDNHISTLCKKAGS